MRKITPTKVCIECKQDLPRKEGFYPRTKARPEIVSSRCKICANKHSVTRYKKKHYGLTPEQIQVLAEAQNFCCAICKTETALVVDHCHQTGRVRGLLCKWCNLALGYFKDDAEVMHRAADYIH